MTESIPSSQDTRENSRQQIVIIGGGVSGLAAAAECERVTNKWRHPPQITLIEGQSNLGGKVATVREGELLLELGAESLLTKKFISSGLAETFGLENQIQETVPRLAKTFVYSRGLLHRLPQGLTGFVPSKLGPLFKSSLLSPWGKLRAAGEWFVRPKGDEFDETLESFIRRRLGKEVYQRLAEPLMCGIFAGRGSELSLLATFPELKRLEQTHGSVLRGLRQRSPVPPEMAQKTPFVSFREGMSTLIGAMEKHLHRTTINLNCPVTQLIRIDERWRIEFAGGSSNLCDAIIGAIPAFSMAHLVKATQPVLSNILREIPHASTATVNLWYDANNFDGTIEGYGLVVPSSEQQFVTAVTWTSSKHLNRAPVGTVLLRAYVGRAGQELDHHLNDEEVLRLVRSDLERLMKVTAIPRGHRVTRWIHGSPQYTLGHLDRLEKIEKELSHCPGLQLCGASYRGVGIPDCILDGQRAAIATLQALENQIESASASANRPAVR